MVPLTLKSSELVDGTIVTGPSTFYIEVNKTLKGTYDKEVWGEEKSNRVLKPAIFIAGQDGYAERGMRRSRSTSSITTRRGQAA